MGQISPSERYRISENGYSMQPSSEGSNISTSNVKPDHPSDIWRFEGTEYANVYVVKNCYTGKTLVLNKVGWSSASINKVLAELLVSPDSHNYFVEMKFAAASNAYLIYPNEGDFNTTYSLSPKDYTHTSGLKDGLIVLGQDNVGQNIHASRWTVTPVTVAVPTFEYNTPTGKVTLKHPEAGYATLYRGTASGSVNTAYTEPFSWTSGRVYAQARLRDSNGTAIVSSAETSYTPVNVETPVITVTGDNAPYHVTITCATSGARIYYAINGVATPDSPEYPTGGFDFAEEMGTITAIAVAQDGANRSLSAVAEKQIKPTQAKDIKDCDDLSGMESTGVYIIINDIEVDENCFSSIASFSGTLEAMINPATNMPYRIIGLKAPLFTTLTGTVKNLVLEGVSINSTAPNTPTGAIARTANGAARIYNVGILSGSVGGTDHTGGLVGQLGGTAHVVNCYSYANVSGGTGKDKYASGIVGNNSATTTAGNINTMVMNCMFYGDITAGKEISPVYGGTIITNLKHGSDRTKDGLNTFNFYAYSELKTKAITKYQCALALENRYLDRFEIHRQLLNSNKKLAAYYATGSADQGSQMLKWVLDKTIATYPILKAQGKYPSVINFDAEHAQQLTLVNGRPSEADRNKGGKIGTLTVKIKKPSDWTNAPDEAKLLDANGNEIETTRTITLNRTDKDTANYNFNYDKVQLPYYNDYGTKNYTDNKVVTGWKITSITGGTAGTYMASDSWGGYNFADRNCTNKDLYGTGGSNRVFSQGAYFDVPYGVTAIEIEPYWAKAAYVADEYLDVVYNTGYSAQSVTQLGEQFPTAKITVDGSEQDVYTTISAALNALSGTSSPTVYDYAVVLVGNLHQAGSINEDDKPFTLMAIDLDKDNEPDYSYIYHGNNRHKTCPLRFDFLNVPGTAQAQKPTGADKFCNASVFNAKSWFEITNTCLIYFSQFEYENSSKTAPAPIILLGGVYDQFVSTKVNEVKYTTYLHVGDNAWFHDFANGTHSDGSKKTKHIPISVTGGDFEDFHLTGTYNADAAVYTDNAECYISGGHFIEAAGAGQEQINGNVQWQIYDADIENFYGGGINDNKPILGTITTEIYNSHVNVYCGGPKFGNMASGMNVTTTAEGCTFGQYFGAGYGGNSISRKKYFDHNTNINWPILQGYYIDDKGKFYDAATTLSNQRPDLTSNANYGYKGLGIAVDFDYEFFVWTSGTTGARFFVKFAAFSLAQCNDVSSTLKDCTVSENFYGGGSLGKVNGKATSVLDNCTVLGNVFGAGYSATLPQVPVRSAGFTSNPDINKNAGIFVPGVLSDTTHYNWEQVDNYPADGTQTFTGTNDNIITTTVITKSNLGSVSGEVTLTLKGNTEVMGNVYGGGDESYVSNTVTPANAKTTVILEGNTNVHGNVYGGGNKGEVSGHSEVIIQDTRTPGK